MSKYIIHIFIGTVLILAYLRYFEYKSLYFPMKEIELVPSAVGLSYEDVYFETEDGVKINAWFIPAKEPDFTLLFSHGNGGNISHRIEKMVFLNGLGCNVFIFDYRGYGKSGGRPSEKGLYRDAQAAYDYLLHKKSIPPDKIIPYGESLGGAIAVDLAAKNDVRALITESMFTSTADVAKVIYPFFPSYLMYSKYDSLRKIRNIAVPKLIIHSKNDDIIPFSLSKKLFDAAKEPKEHVVLIGSHNSCYVDSKDKYISAINGFLKAL